MSDRVWMTQAEYAQHRGVSHVAVYKAVKAGRITTVDGKIDPKAADVEWAQNTRPRADLHQPRAAVEVEPEGRPQAGSDDSEDYWTARARRERAEAAISEIRRAELEGKLIRTEAVRSAWARRLASARDALLQIPHRLAPVVAAESDMERVGQLLEDELRDVLEELSRGDVLGEGVA